LSAKELKNCAAMMVKNPFFMGSCEGCVIK
jgi:hypothetical protein